MRKVLVTGGRDFDDYASVCETLDALHGEDRIVLVIHGGAPGADQLAGSWARYRKIQEAIYPANWQGLGPSAGPIRNRAMVEHSVADLLVAFPGGRGTANCVELAMEWGVRVLAVAKKEA